jgi:hypothetical protein
VSSSGGDVRVIGTTEHTKVIVARCTKESMVRGGSWGGGRNKPVEQLCGDVKTLRPKARGHRGLDQKGLLDIVRGTSHPLGLVVMGRSVQTRHADLNTPREEEGAGVVIELGPIVTLDGLIGEAELSGHLGTEVEGGESLRLGTQWKSPRVMGEIINHHKIVFITRETRHRRRPHITVNKIKGMHRTRRRKRKANMRPH